MTRRGRTLSKFGTKRQGEGENSEANFDIYPYMTILAICAKQSAVSIHLQPDVHTCTAL